MPQLTVTSTPQQIPSVGGGTLVIENIDAANPIYVGKTNTVASSGATGGLKVLAGGDIEWLVDWAGGSGVAYGSPQSAPFVVCASGQTALIAWEILRVAPSGRG